MVSIIVKGTKIRMTTLEERRWRGDMIQTRRILSGKDRVSAGIWLDMEVDRGREGATTTSHAIRPRKFKNEERGYLFSRINLCYASLRHQRKERPPALYN